MVYVVSLQRAMSSAWSGGVARGEAVVVDAATWLWRPRAWPAGARASVRFELPEGLEVATSWPVVGTDTFEFAPAAFGYLSHIALGRFSRMTVAVPGTTAQVIRLPGTLTVTDEQIRSWIARSATLVSKLRGEFPVPNPLILVVPVPAGRDPVAFGAVGRGGGPSVMFLVRANATVDALYAEWVAPHEFSHLAFPFVRRSERFFSEGLATYFQEVLRVWGGVLTELEGWQRLDAGFRAGMRNGTGRTLRHESRDVFRTFAFRRIYWYGAAIALFIDIELQKRGSSLAAALASLPRSARERAASWEAQALAERLDEGLAEPVFATVLNEHLESTEFPDLDPVYTFLGVTRDDSGRVVSLDDDAPGAEIRRGVMADPVASGPERSAALRAH